MRIKKIQQGFSLIETVLYVAIAAIVLGGLFSLYISIYRLRVKTQSLGEVEQQGQQIMQLIDQTVRNAQSLSTPATGTSASTLSLKIYDSGLSPTVFSLSSGAVLVQEGAKAPVALNSSRVTVSNLLFQNLTRTGTHGIVRVTFTVSFVNPGGFAENNYTKSFYDSAALRATYP